ncbi:MAG: PmoA family protein, partial [Planctomycetales bacterium]|nr:PmoA family protein [Planctomycetales bacterium]
YHCFKNYRKADDPSSGYKHYIRHQGFDRVASTGGRATAEARLHWIVNESTPVIIEQRSWTVVALEGRDYLIDLEWSLTPALDEATFVSDWVHYAWPYLRIHPQFSGEQGGTIASDAGAKGADATNGKPAKWIDYANSIEGAAEGVAVFIFPDEAQHNWLTREYGTFGPRRPDDQSGTHFTLAKGQKLNGRVGVYVHDGDVASGRVAEIYDAYVKGRLTQ